MLKIYNAYNKNGKIILEDHIDFKDGEFDTGPHGFGEVKTINPSCERVNYELQQLKSYKKYLQDIKISDGYVENFMILSPFTYEMIADKYKDIPKNFETYEKLGLNEEGILLFTNGIYLNCSEGNSVQRIFGRYPEIGMYLIMPNTTFHMTPDMDFYNNKRCYEVLQSKTLGKHLVLTQRHRKV